MGRSEATSTGVVPPEVWMIIGEKIDDQRTLNSLTKVSRTFHSIFAKYLYHRYSMSIAAVFRQAWSSSLSSSDLWCVPARSHSASYLHHVRNFEVDLECQCQPATGYVQKERMTDCHVISESIRDMPNLSSFSFRSGQCIPSDITASGLLDTLKYCRTLQKLEILLIDWKKLDSLEEIHEAEGLTGFFTPELVPGLRLKGFGGLSSLELWNLYGPHDELAKELASVLCASPGLETLGLSLACRLNRNQFPIVHDQGIFFGVVYKAFAATNPSRLSLTTLQLGQGFYLPEKQTLEGVDVEVVSEGSGSVEDAEEEWTEDGGTEGAETHYLSKFTDITALKRLHLCNGITELSRDEDYVPWCPLDLFTKETSPNLLKFSINRLQNDIVDWLNELQSVQELIVTSPYDRSYVNDLDVSKLKDLKVNLTMLYIRDRKPQATTILDRLPDGGTHLTRLGISLTLETQWFHFATQLRTLTSLTHLRLEPTVIREALASYPPPGSSRWPGIRDPEQLAYHYAILAAHICPSLRYIKIGICVFRLNLVFYALGRTIVPERLQEDEWRNIELFAIKVSILP